MPPQIPLFGVPSQLLPTQCLTRSCPRCSLSSRQFSSTSSHNKRTTLLRRRMYAWLDGPGQVFRDPLPNSTNYLSAYDKAGRLVRAREGSDRDNETESEQDKSDGENDEDPDAPEAAAEQSEAARSLREFAQRQDQNSGGGDKTVPPESLQDFRPFPQNAQFISQPVLSVELRDEIFRRVKDQGLDVTTVSAQLGVAIERVGAVVRLKAVEEEWIKEGKKLATPYQKSVIAMLPTTPFSPTRQQAHEPINDISVHPRTRPQLFVPVSESRQFTRDDAAKAFDNHLLPAHERIPHPEMVQAEKHRLNGMTDQDVQVWMKEEKARKEVENRERERKRAEREAQRTRMVGGRRWDFRFEDISVEDVGRDGLSEKGVGWRYGAPHDDRKKGKVKIPTSVV